MNRSLRRAVPTALFATMSLWSVFIPSAFAAELSNPIPQSIPPGEIIGLEPIATGMTSPNWATSAPGDSGRLFVVDQVGTLWAVNLASGDKTVFANLSALLVPLGVGGPGTYDERGFLGLAFDPNYQTNGLLYTYTSEPAEGNVDFPVPLGAPANHYAVISEWHVANPQNASSVVDPSSRRVLLRIGEPQFNHNGGALNFGPDGMLYIALGDGGAADDQGAGHSANGNAQDLTNLLGKILRINPHATTAPNGQYGIPSDNPLANAESVGGATGCADGACDEIYAWGFRNPFRFSFDTGTGAMYVGDVGQNDIEEVDVVTAGNNYGWPIKEGTFCFDNNGTGNGFVTDASPCPTQPPGLVDPLVEYDHDEGTAIIGGFVYRGSRAPTLAGRYLFGDYAHGPNQGRLFAIDNSSNGTAGATFSELRVYGQNGLGMSLLGFGEDASHDVYVLANSTGVPSGTTGTVMRITSRASVQQQRNYRARLTGDQQVPAPIDTPAIGQTLIHVSDDGTSLEVLVMVARIVNVIGAHIHLAPPGANGPIVASFIPDTAGFLANGALISTPINVEGVLVRGTITAADLVGPLAGQRLKALIDAINSGNTYFNVHTSAHQPGEIRGLIR